MFVFRLFTNITNSYNTYATELEVSNTVRNILLGNSPQSINEKHYINRRTIKLSEKVQQAHTEILEDFRFEELSLKLYFKMINFVTDKDKKIFEKVLNELSLKYKSNSKPKLLTKKELSAKSFTSISIGQREIIS